MISRRDFLTRAVKVAALLGGTGTIFQGLSRLRTTAGHYPDQVLAADIKEEILRAAPRARFWTSLPLAGGDCLKCHGPEEKIRNRRHTHKENSVKCLLCAQQCVILPNETGKCRSRRNVGGELRSLVYGRPVSVHIDPVEKKPFYHFLPGSAAFSLATAGCPLAADSARTGRSPRPGPKTIRSLSPRDVIVDSAFPERPRSSPSPTTSPRSLPNICIDIARQARKRQIRSALVSCGFMNEAPLKEMCEVLDAIKIDLKGFSPILSRCLPGGTPPGAAKHQRGCQEQGPSGNRQSGCPHPQRFGKESPSLIGLGGLGNRSRGAGPFYPLSPGLPDAQSAADPGGHPGAGPVHRP